MSWPVVTGRELTRHAVRFAVRREFRGLRVATDDPLLDAAMAHENDQSQWEYAFRWPGPVRIEPTHGYVVTADGGLVAESVPYSRYVGMPPPLPDGPVVRVDAVVSLREDGDANYYHFLDDVLGRLELFDRVGVDHRTPLLISARLAGQPYFRSALRLSSALRARTWLVQQPGEVVQAGEVVFGKPLPHARTTLAAVADLFDVPPADPPADPAGGRRVLLVRARARGRYVRNAAAVEAVCRERGFEVVDPDLMDLAEQVEVFSGARYVVGPHGAGLVNLLWRRGAPASLLELFPPESTPAHYQWLCRSFGFTWSGLRGDGGSAADGFTVDPDRVAAALDRLLA